MHLHHDKAIFKIEGLPVEAFAAPLGLAGAPKIRLLTHAQLKFGEAPTHLIFDDDGVAHEAIEMKAVEEIFGAGDARRVALEAGQTFGEKKHLKSIK